MEAPPSVSLLEDTVVSQSGFPGLPGFYVQVASLSRLPANYDSGDTETVTKGWPAGTKNLSHAEFWK